MTSTTTNAATVHPEAEAIGPLFDNWFDPIEAGLRERVRGFIEMMLETELDAVLARPRYGRQPAVRGHESAGIAGHRHGRRTRALTGTFGTTEIAVPRAGLDAGEGKTVEWKSKALRAYQRRTMAADALIASVYLSGTNTRRVRRALAALFGGAIGEACGRDLGHAIQPHIFAVPTALKSALVKRTTDYRMVMPSSVLWLDREVPVVAGYVQRLAQTLGPIILVAHKF